MSSPKKRGHPERVDPLAKQSECPAFIEMELQLLEEQTGNHVDFRAIEVAWTKNHRKHLLLKNPYCLVAF